MKLHSLKNLWIKLLLLLILTGAQSAAALTTDEIAGLNIGFNDLMAQQPVMLPENYQSTFGVMPVTADGLSLGAYEYSKNHDLEYSVANPDVLEISLVGLFDYGWQLSMKTKAAGTTAVSFKIKDTSIALTTEITVGNDLKTTALKIGNVNASQLVAGATVKISASRTPYWSTEPIEWISSDHNIMQLVPESVSGNSAEFKLVGEGECEITVRSVADPAVSDSRTFTIAPTPALSNLSIYPPAYFSGEITRDLTYRFEASCQPAIFTDRLVWTSSDESVLKFEPEEGGKSVLVTAPKYGEATLTVASADNPALTSSVTIKVVEPGLQELWEVPSTMYVGETSQEIYLYYTPMTMPVEPRVIEATVADPSILTVETTRIEMIRHYYTITALREGVTEVIFSDATGARLVKTVTVKPRVLEQLSISGLTSIFCSLGNSFTYSARVTPTGAPATIEWSIDNTDVAEISDATGLDVNVKALTTGKFTLKAKSVENPSIVASMEVSVVSPDWHLPEYKEIDMIDGNCVVYFEPNFLYAFDYTSYPYEIESSDTGVVKAQRMGGELTCIELIPVSPGEAVVTIRVAGTDVYAQIKVKVYNSDPASLDNCFSDNDTLVDVYNLKGQLIMSHAAPETLHSLTPGLYIISGKLYLKH